MKANKKRRKIIILVILMIAGGISVYLIWFFNSPPRLDASKISSVQQQRMPSSPETITIDDEDTIHKFVEYFNTLEFTPQIVIKFPSGGWFSNNRIRFKGSQRELNITCEDKYDDGYVLIKFNRRYYKTSMISYNNLLDIISRKEIPPQGFVSSAAGYLLEI